MQGSRSTEQRIPRRGLARLVGRGASFPSMGAAVVASVLFVLAPCPARVAAADPWRQDRFLVGGWIPVEDPSALLRLAEAGFDYVHVRDPFPVFNRMVAARLDSLARARPGFRLRYVAHFKAPIDDPGRVIDNDDPVGNWPRIRASLSPAAGMNRRSTLGWLLSDEPLTRAAMRRIADLTRRMRDDPATAGQLPYVNLFPAIDPGTNGTYAEEFGREPRAAYGAYLRSYLSQFEDDPDPAPVLSFDHYPFQATTRPTPLWFLTLAVARDEARAASRPAVGKFVPVWAVLQGSDHRPRGRKSFPGSFTRAQLRWQVWSAVAYGVKGIAYWTLSPAEDRNAGLGFAAGIFDARGGSTALLPVVRRLNAELHALGAFLMELDAIGARHVSTQGQEGIDDERWVRPDGRLRPLGPLTGVESGPGADDALVTLLRHRRTGEDWVFVFNKSVSVARSFRIRLAAAPARVERIRRADGRPETVASAASVFATGSLAAGTGDLFRIDR